MSFIVGVTGGIASGKTLVTNLLAQWGCCIVDTDVLARAVVEPGTSGLRQLQQRFGDDIITAEGHLNRPLLRQWIFADASIRQEVEAITHPLVYEAMANALAQPCQTYHVLVSPLLVEKRQYQRCQRILLVDVPPALQIERVMARDGIAAQQAQAILAAQASRQARQAVATEIIDNSGDIDKVAKQLYPIHQQYLELAHESAMSNLSD